MEWSIVHVLRSIAVMVLILELLMMPIVLVLILVMVLTFLVTVELVLHLASILLKATVLWVVLVVLSWSRLI